MKKALIILLVINFAGSGYCQDTTFIGENGVIVNGKKEAVSYKVISRFSSDTNQVSVKYYYLNDKLKGESNYSVYSKGLLDGKRTLWYESGALKETVNYRNGKIIDYRITYWKNGEVRRKDKFSKGELVNGKVWDSTGKKQVYYNYYEDARCEKSSAFGGIGNYIANNVQYPQEAMENNIQGVVKVGFVIDLDGSITNVEIIEGVSEELDKEALRLITTMPKWIPAKCDGEPSRQRMLLPIRFEL